MDIIKQDCYKGTRILVGNEKSDYLTTVRGYLKTYGFNEIQIPIIQHQDLFKNKVGEENNNLMFNFKDRGSRDICLSPEYTAIIQNLSKTYYKTTKDVKLFYISECFRGEKPQAGRYRQFTQLGVEIINPSKNYDLPVLANDLLNLLGHSLWESKKIKDKSEFEKLFTINTDATRGLDYYKEGKGFEIYCDKLGSSRQICGGGEYDGGVGFAIGVDRLMQLIYDNNIS